MANASGDVPVKRHAKAEPALPGVERVWHPLLSLHDEVNKVFDDFFSGFGRFPSARRFFDMEPLQRIESSFGATVPAVDWVEKAGEFRITAELPGLDEKDIEVTLTDDLLTIKGEKSEEKEEKKKEYYLSERRYGSFRRTFRLPEGVEAGKVSAKFDNGVLSIVLPKMTAARKKVRKVRIKTK